MRQRRAIGSKAFILGSALGAMLAVMGGQAATAQGDEPEGLLEYRRACASCHGLDGRGDGPVSDYLNTPPADLTQLARNFGGAFPALVVRQLIDGRVTDRVHGRADGEADMPVWGDRFMLDEDSETDPEESEAVIQERIRAVTAYIESIQEY